MHAKHATGDCKCLGTRSYAVGASTPDARTRGTLALITRTFGKFEAIEPYSLEDEDAGNGGNGKRGVPRFVDGERLTNSTSIGALLRVIRERCERQRGERLMNNALARRRHSHRT